MTRLEKPAVGDIPFVVDEHAGHRRLGTGVRDSIVIGRQAVMMPAPAHRQQAKPWPPVARPVELICSREYHDVHLVGNAVMMFSACVRGVTYRFRRRHSIA